MCNALRYDLRKCCQAYSANLARASLPNQQLLIHFTSWQQPSTSQAAACPCQACFLCYSLLTCTGIATIKQGTLLPVLEYYSHRASNAYSNAANTLSWFVCMHRHGACLQMQTLPSMALVDGLKLRLTTGCIFLTCQALGVCAKDTRQSMPFRDQSTSKLWTCYLPLHTISASSMLLVLGKTQEPMPPHGVGP